MADEDGANALLFEQGADLEDQLHPHLGVDVGEGLVQQHQARLAHQGAGDGHPLLLAAGELMGIALPQPLQVDQRQRLFHLLLAAAAILPGQAEADVLGHRQVRKESVILEDHADMAGLRRHTHAGGIEQGLSQPDLPLGQGQQTGHRLEQRGLATAAGPKQTDNLVVGHLQGELLQHGAAIVVTADLLDIQAGQGSFPLA